MSVVLGGFGTIVHVSDVDKCPVWALYVVFLGARDSIVLGISGWIFRFLWSGIISFCGRCIGARCSVV